MIRHGNTRRDLVEKIVGDDQAATFVARKQRQGFEIPKE
jgi:hypothetical protein